MRNHQEVTARRLFFTGNDKVLSVRGFGIFRMSNLRTRMLSARTQTDIPPNYLLLTT